MGQITGEERGGLSEMGVFSAMPPDLTFGAIASL
jgi:hypothetical protein